MKQFNVKPHSVVDQLIVDVVCDATLPHSFVENKPTRKLLETAFPGRKIMHRKGLVQRIEENFKAMQHDMKIEFEKVTSVCLTADSWTSYRRAFIGVTAHWICDETLKRKHYALSCKRIIGKQSGEVLATKIEEIINFYGLNGKVVRVITGNGKNYIKAFKLFDERKEGNEGETEDHDDDEIEPFEITDCLSTYQSTTNNSLLPPHGRCCAHTLNLVMSKDMPKGIADTSSAVFKRLHGEMISKCLALFNKQNRSSKMADIVKTTIGRYLLTPVTVRWNSEHNSLKLLSELFISKPTEMNTLFEALQLPMLSNDELVFLHEYVKVVDVIANALNVMQGEEFMYTGLFTPTVLHLLSKLDAISDLKYCDCLRSIIRGAINNCQNESVSSWYARIKQLALQCKYGANLDVMVMDKFITQLPEKIFMKLCEEDEKLTLPVALKKALIFETKFAMRTGVTDLEVNLVRSQRGALYHKSNNNNNNRNNNNANSNNRNNRNGKQLHGKKIPCTRCGWRTHEAKSCPYKEATYSQEFPIVIDQIKSEFSSLFDGQLGKYNVCEISLSIDSDAKPVFCKPRSVPIAWKSKLERDLRNLVEKGIV
ncbi:hypothetical protein Bhyg_13188 [Pseudolycoriella hygida]|uniref:Transposase n=1 Tax=Pseudolycoriella hygida TaxID=35572 RepID=A0A9Q0RW68_9DIPT|nr:hypothetical protein Bhyg_13188 [Pseudolycoriella hygida]